MKHVTKVLCRRTAAVAAVQSVTAIRASAAVGGRERDAPGGEPASRSMVTSLPTGADAAPSSAEPEQQR